MIVKILKVKRKREDIEGAKEVRKNKRRRNTSGILSIDAIGVRVAELKLDWMVLNRFEILRVMWVSNFRLKLLWRETLAFKTDELGRTEK